MSTSDACVGQTVIIWNRVEAIIMSILRLYLNTDRQTADIILGPQRTVDREKLLRKLVELKEIDEAARSEVLHLIGACARLRENRNLVIHNLASPHDELSEDGLCALRRVESEVRAFEEYALSVYNSLEAVIFDREAREIVTDEEGGTTSDEERPLLNFQCAAAFALPAKLSIEDIS